MDKLYYKSATQIAKAILARETSSSEALDIHFKRIAEHNPKINAVITLNEEDARKKAKEADEALAKGKVWGPLHGVPFTAKDTFITANLKTCFSNPLYKNYVPKEDATLVAKLKQAGAILMGKTNAPDFAFDWQSNSALFGRTSNPYHLDHIVGGSSGGSAAALASGFTPICLGSDIGGSLRVPAHCCGITTIRPTEHALSDFGHLLFPDQPKVGRSMVTCGPMTRNIEDLKLAISVVWDKDTNNWLVPPVELKNQPSITTLKGLKVAYNLKLGTVCQETKKLFQQFLDLLTKEGCKVEEAQPKDFDLEQIQEVWGIICGASDILASLPITALKFLPKLWLRYKFPNTSFLKSLIKGINSSNRKLMYALQARDKFIQTADEFFTTYDVWLTPVGTSSAFKHCKTGSQIPVDSRQIPYTDFFAPFNCPTTVLANPIAVIPIGVSPLGLPIGVQIHARRWQDWRLLEIAGLMENLTGGFKPPKL